MPDRVMVDIETLGTEPGCAILSIGAVRFDKHAIHEEFNESIRISSCDEAGLEIDAGTLEWWLDQDDSVTGVLTGGDRLGKVLWRFSRFYGDADEIWAFSPSFDCDILAHAYDAVGEAPPWTYRDERCARTIAALPVAADVERDGNEHDALEDARYQASIVLRTLARLDEVAVDA